MRKPSLLSSSSTTSKSITPCCSKVGIKKGPWTPEEDEVLANYVKSEGEGRWRTLPKRAGLLRCGKSCRLRWMNYLRPSVKRGRFAPDEEDLILRLHRLLGNRWSLIAGRIPGRTDNDVKNYWNTHLSKKLISQGIDPRNHKPLNLISRGSSMDPNPPNPNSSESAEKNTVTQDFMATNLEYHDDQQYQIQQVVDNSMADWHNSKGQRQSSSCHGNEGDYIANCSEDILISSFLDSLINDNYLFVNQQQQQQQQQQPLPPMPQPSNIVAAFPDRNFSYGGNIWEAEEIMSSSSMAAFGNQQTSSNNLHQQYGT